MSAVRAKLASCVHRSTRHGFDAPLLLLSRRRHNGVRRPSCIVHLFVYLERRTYF
jgi:hypothetical protein